MQCRFIALFVLALFVFSCDQDKPTAQVESAPAHLDESLTTIEVNGAVFRRVAAKAVSTAQGGDMSIVLNYSMAGSKATIASVTIDGVRFLASDCDPSTKQGIVELVTDDAITPSTQFESPTQIELPEIEYVGGAIWKHFGPYKLEAGATNYFELSVGPRAFTNIISLSDGMGLRGQTLLPDGEPWIEESSGDGPGGENFVLVHGNVDDGETNLHFKVSGANSTTEGTYTLFVQSVRSYGGLDRDVGDSRSTAFEIPFTPFLFEDYALHYYFGPSNLYLTEGDRDYFVIDVPQKVRLIAGFSFEENGIVNPSIKLVRSNRRIAASGSDWISKTIDAGKYWIKIEGDPPAGQDAGRYSFSYHAYPASE